MKRPGSKKYGTRKALGVILVVGLVAAGTYAFTAANTVPATKAGSDAETISGYTISNVTYNNIANADTISSYSFDLDAPATRVSAKILSTQLAYDTCTLTGALTNTWTCTANGLLGVATLAADELKVVAVQ